MKIIITTILFFSFIISCLAQKDTSTFKLSKIIQGDIIDFSIDNLGNFYTLNRDNQLKKLNADGDSIAVFNDVRRYGRVFSIDATNPLKLLLYYKDFGTIVILDRFLNVRNTINLQKINIFQVKAISQSYDNGVWIYDEQDARLKRMNDDGNIVDQSADLRLFIDPVPSPVRIIDQDRLVYLYDPEKGLFIFDYFGSLKNKVGLLGWEDFQVVDGKAFGRKGTVISQYQQGSLSLQEQTLTILSKVEKIRISLNHLYCLRDGAITVYAF